MVDLPKLRLVAFLPRNMAFALGALAIIVLGGAAHAVTDTIFKYTNPRTGFFTIDPMALSVDDDNRSYTIDYANGNISGAGCFSTGLNLPNGSTITALTVWIASGAGTDPNFVLLRRDLGTGNADFLLNHVDVHDDSTQRTAHIFKFTNSATAKVDNTHTFAFAVCLPDATNFFLGARVAYTYTTAGD
jgi:hypothetical protein